jgi:Protein of unknown function (DUF2380)
MDATARVHRGSWWGGGVAGSGARAETKADYENRHPKLFRCSIFAGKRLLILNINLYMEDERTGQLQFAKSVDIRSNTDESWRRGLDYLVHNYLLAPR